MKRPLLTILDRLGGERRIHYALDHFKNCLKEVGHPDPNVQSLVISGTNGKGSTTLFLSAALRASGRTVATYLSPHLQDPTERFLHNLVPANPVEMDALALEFEPIAKKYQLSYFEFLTLLFFVWASRKKVDVLVLEVGLGGRLDCTNVTNPIACALTNVSFDHQAYLGNTLKAILTEKIAISRRGSKLFTAIADPKLLSQAQTYCAQNGVQLESSLEMETATLARNWKGQHALIDGYPFAFTNPTPVTIQNAALAYALIRKTFPDISIPTIYKGFKALRTPGRLEVMQENPRVILSGDHNPAGVASLKETLKKLPPTQFHTVCAFSPDKPYQALFSELKSLSKEIVLTQINDAKGPLPEGYTAISPRFEKDAKKAVAAMIAQCPPDETVLVTGSLYLVGEVRTLWQSSVSFLENPL